MATLNVSYESALSGESLAVLARTRADVIVVSEWTGHNFDLTDLQAMGFDVVLDARAAGGHGYLVVASKARCVSATLHANPWTSYCAIPYVSIRVETAGNELSMIALHAPPPRSGCNGANDRTLRGLASSLERRERIPAILLGDFNSLPFEAETRALLALGYADAVLERHGRWIGTWTSWQGVPAFAPIDYILVREDLSVIGAWVVAIAGSDHRLVVADVGSPRTSPRVHGTQNAGRI